MGSTGLYLTPREAAEVLGVVVSMVRVYDRRQLLEGHYPEGKKAGRRYRAEDVYALAELRAEGKGDLLRRLPQIAVRAVATSRRVEKKLEDLMNFLGLNDVALSLDRESIIAFHQEVEVALSRPRAETDDEVITWSKHLLSINEEYLELVKHHIGEAYPWKPYLELARLLSIRAGARPRMFMEHARANLRNVAYFYERAFRGAAEAEKIFPGERYSGRLLSRLLPTS